MKNSSRTRNVAGAIEFRQENLSLSVQQLLSLAAVYVHVAHSPSTSVVEKEEGTPSYFFNTLASLTLLYTQAYSAPPPH